MSSIQRFSQLIPPSGVLEFAGGNFALLLSATVAVDLRVERGNGGHAERFDSQTGGILIRRVQPWSNFRILGTAGTTVVLLYGQADTDIDETDIRLQIATIAGVATTAEAPATGATTSAVTALAATTAGLSIAANASRKRITISAPDTNTATVYVQPGAVGVADRRGLPLAPGTFIEVKNTVVIGLYNPDAAAQNYSYTEET